MNDEKTTLDHRGQYFLGVLSERSTEWAMKNGKFNAAEVRLEPSHPREQDIWSVSRNASRSNWRR
jgi:hypothetical protein